MAGAGFFTNLSLNFFPDFLTIFFQIGVIILRLAWWALCLNELLSISGLPVGSNKGT